MVVIFKLFVLRAHSTPLPPPPPGGLNRFPLRAFKNDHTPYSKMATTLSFFYIHAN